MLGYEEKLERIKLIDAVGDAGRLARDLDQLDPLNVEGILALRSISERCAERIGDASRIPDAQNEVFYAEGQEPALSAARRKGTLRSRRGSRRVARSASSIPAGARNWGALDQLSPLMVSSRSTM